jgi:hypothetical protein
LPVIDLVGHRTGSDIEDGALCIKEGCHRFGLAVPIEHADRDGDQPFLVTGRSCR